MHIALASHAGGSVAGVGALHRAAPAAATASHQHHQYLLDHFDEMQALHVRKQ